MSIHAEFLQLLQWLQALPVSLAIRGISWLFPLIETVHVLAIVLVVGTIAIVDLRILGFTARSRPLAEVAASVLPFTWASFSLAVISGSLLFASDAADYAHNLPFQVKMLLLLLAGANMLLFHWLTRGARLREADLVRLPVLWRASGAASLLFWISVVVAGRWIGFVL